MLETELVKPGKGQAFTPVKLRNLIIGPVWEKTLKSGVSIEATDVIERYTDYLYKDGGSWYFMTTAGNNNHIEAGAPVVREAG